MRGFTDDNANKNPKHFDIKLLRAGHCCLLYSMEKGVDETNGSNDARRGRIDGFQLLTGRLEALHSRKQKKVVRLNNNNGNIALHLEILEK
ncbi:hypothetical protein JTB14_005368 [Gonioctena quinquepunctata]|nr:hypothetical protein JTB14_005368 [Gonioctena quinquepunctata]